MESSVPGAGLNVFLLNQSRSMGGAFGDYGVTMAEAATDAINLYLQKVVQFRLALPEEFKVDDFGVVVLGYGSGEDAEKPILRMDADTTVLDKKRTRYDETTISASKNLPNYPFWVLPVAEGDAPLRRALSSAADVIEDWTAEHRSAARPMVMNVTNGTMTDGDPTGDAERIKRISTSTGHPVLWNCHLASSRSAPILFPRDDDADALTDQFRTLLRSSSLVPQEKIRDLSMDFPEVSRPVGARTCVMDADFPTLVRLISCATRLPLP
jgi:hypothetical protein